MGSVLNSDDNSDMEEEVIGPDGILIKKKRNKDEDDISDAGSEYLRQKMLKRAGSVDTLASVEDPNNVDQKKSKRRLNEHTLTHLDSNQIDTDKETKEDNILEQTDKVNIEADKNSKGDKVANRIFVRSKTGESIHNDENDKEFSRKRLQRTANGIMFDDLSEDDIEKISDRDSGMDEEEDVDVTLNKEQQQMVVNMLFDEEMNLRPQFYRNENGQIVVSQNFPTKQSFS